MTEVVCCRKSRRFSIRFITVRELNRLRSVIGSRVHNPHLNVEPANGSMKSLGLKAQCSREPRGSSLSHTTMHLYETHIPVTDTKNSETFYREVVGLPLAYRDPSRDIVFLWVDEKQKGMLGLWGPSTVYGRQNGALTPCHLAFAVPLEQLQRAIKGLNQRGIKTRGFGGDPTSEPSVIGWMPSAQIYFRDPDGHSLEFITILPEPPRAGFLGSYSEWVQLNRQQP